ncbi:MAG: ABC transporter substrate-binding protein [Thermaerobacterales bacterium]
MSISKRHFGPVVAGMIILAMALLVSGCGELLPGRGLTDDQPSRPAGQFGGIWEDFAPRDPQTLDPVYAVTLLEGRILTLVYNGLVRLSAEGRIIPDLAAGWEIQDDGLTYLFNLRQDAQFHSGRSLTARDVEFSFRRLLDPDTASPRAWVLSSIAGARQFSEGLAEDLAGVEVLDDHTLRITLERPYAQFLHHLTMPAAFVVDGETLSEMSPADWLPVGTGPFMLAEWRSGEHLFFTAFEEYYHGRPFLDAVRLRVIGNRAAAVDEFAAGNLHAMTIRAAERQKLLDDEGFMGPMAETTQPAVYYLGLNNQIEPLSDPLVRQAIHHAIDREALLSAVMPGDYVEAHGAIPPGMPGHDPARRGRAFDPLKARQLLTQAGVEEFTLTITQTQTWRVNELNRALAGMLERVGIDVNLRTVSTAEFYRQIDREGDAEAFILSWWADYPDAENFLYPLFHSGTWGAGGNRSRFSSPDVDVLLGDLRTAHDEQDRAELYRQVEDAVFQRDPWVPLYFPKRYHAVQGVVENYYPAEYYQAQDLWAVWLRNGSDDGE